MIIVADVYSYNETYVRNRCRITKEMYDHYKEMFPDYSEEDLVRQIYYNCDCEIDTDIEEWLEEEIDDVEVIGEEE